MKKILLVGTIILAMLFALTGCGNTDVVAKSAKASFDSMLKAAQVSGDKEGNTQIIAKDGQIFSFGLSGTKMMLPIAPFIEAGLDAKKLPSNILVEDNYLVIKKDYKGKSFAEIIDKYRENIDYHPALDHYGISMGDGVVFEWAKELAANDKDIVFVLDPKQLVNAGVSVETMKGYVYKEVEQKDKTKAFKVLAPFNLK